MWPFGKKTEHKPDTSKLCVECKWATKVGEVWWFDGSPKMPVCVSPECNPTSPVTGRVVGEFCETHRTAPRLVTGAKACGLDARCFKRA